MPDPAFHGSPRQPDVRIALFRTFEAFPLRLFLICFQKMPIRVRSLRIERTDPVAHASHVLMGQDRGLYAEAIQNPGHDHKGPMAAFRCFIAKRFVKVEQLLEGRPTADIHDPPIVFRPFLGEPIGPVFLEFVGKVPAGDQDRPSSGICRSSGDDLPKAVMVGQGQPG